jgi:hypothetical protein
MPAGATLPRQVRFRKLKRGETDMRRDASPPPAALAGATTGRWAEPVDRRIADAVIGCRDIELRLQMAEFASLFSAVV